MNSNNLKHIIFLILTLSYLTSNSQTNIDSLENRLSKSKSKVEKIDLLNKLSEANKRISPQKTVDYANDAIRLATNNDNEILLAKSLENAGDGYFILGQLDTSLSFYKKSFKIYDKHQDFNGISEVYLDLGNIYYFNAAYDSAKFFYKKSIHFKSDIGDDEGLIRLYNNLGSVYKKTGEINKATESLESALEISSKLKNNNKKGSVLINLSSIFLSQGKLSEAMKYNIEALKVGQEINDLYTISNAYTNLTDIYSYIDDYNKALEYQRKSLQIDLRLEDREGIITAYNNIGEIYHNLNKLDSAEYYFNQSLELHNSKNVKLDFESTTYNLGIIQKDKKNYSKALNYFNQSLTISTEINDISLILDNHLAISEIYLETGNLVPAEKHLNQAYSLTRENVLKDGYRVYELLSVLSDKKGDYKKALYFHRLYDSFKDSVLIVKKAAKISDIKSIYDLKEHNGKIESLSKDNEIQFNQTQKQKRFKNIAILGSGTIIILLIFIIFNFRNKIRTAKILNDKNEQIKQKNEEIKQKTDHLLQINAELEKLSIVASKTDNAIIISSPSGEIEWINEGYTRLFGYTFAELLNLKGKTYFETSSNSKIDEIFEKALTEKKSQIYESDMISKDGKKYRIHTTLTPILNDKTEVVKLIAIDSDISKLKEVEEELQKLLVTKDKFFSIIAHDLKNPFNTLIGLSQLLVNGYERMSPEKVKYFHNNLYQISKKGYELLINLLEWSRSQMGSIKFQPAEQKLFALTEETFTLYNSKATQKEIQLLNQINPNSKVIADTNMIKTIFRNLVSNALKFTDRGGIIEISEKIAGNYTEVSIRDTGVGIEPDDIEKLFKLDHHLTTEGTEEESGTGLGLILCKEFVEKQGGKIWVESKVGFGSKFIFTLPKNEPPERTGG